MSTRRWRVLASDFDGTLATEGWVPVEALAAVARLRANGGRFVLVTGRRVPELLEVFPDCPQVVDLVIAENGAVLFDPANAPPMVIAPRLPRDIKVVLRGSGVSEFQLGDALVSASRTEEIAVRRAAHRLEERWPCQVVPNRNRVMLLPQGVDKGTGLQAAVRVLGVSVREVLAIGDGENDVALLQTAGLGVAVADAVPGLQAHADLLTKAAASAGVVEAIDCLLTA